ncbi:Esterase-6 [Eumeta japonica]|uniref:Carboxylic ester hydrolase n=1 Tax=Eumeta variegata TaxID=151549 RepID=A0A4C1YDL0_EUMVA|nr:Esterase-6 [Eumeta japonica]
MLIFLFIIIAAADANPDDNSRIVHTAQGAVKGYRDHKGYFYGYYGIPYATAPTGPHKFKSPLPPPSWEDTFDAIDKKILCPQSEIYLQMLKTDLNYTIQEDCLIANVYVPDTEDDNLPVVFYVHGGAFQLGFGSAILHRSLLRTRKIIIVNFNYRLGAHGFLCLGTEDIPGNAGLKDQVAALRWVKNNIASFGGNPDDITIMGSSAGAASVELLMLSKATRGLFNKVIPESGAGVGVWAVQNDPLEIAKSYARTQGFFEVDDIHALEDFFKYISLDVLQADLSMNRRESTFNFVPCVERDANEDAVLTEAPVDILRKGDYEKTPMLVGFTDMEGIFRINFFEDWKDEMNEDFSNFLPADLQFADESERQEMAQRIKEFYFGEKPVSSETAVAYVNYFSDVLFFYPTYRSISMQDAAGNREIYLYVYAFVEDRSFAPYPGVTGADHSAQTMALGYIPLRSQRRRTKMSEDYKKIKRLLTDVWANFITTSKPTPEGSLAAETLGEWPPTSPELLQHALLNTTSELRVGLWPDRMALWDDIYSKHYRTPVPPPEQLARIKSEL